MRTSPASVAIDLPAESAQSRVDEVIRTLVGLMESVSVGAAAAVNGAGSAEEVLVDAEIDGNRYLLVRMPRSARGKIQLSPREQEIVRMVAKGHPNKVIADVLNISSWTVCTHLRRIFAKLGVGSRAAMVAQLHQIGAITADHRMHSDLR
jgi:DNA-binding CsgD family transcriptional regulator